MASQDKYLNMKSVNSYKCEYPGCENVQAILSKIKTGDHKGKRVCNYHKNMLEPSLKRSQLSSKKTQLKKSPLSKFSKTNKTKSKNYKGFFDKMILKLYDKPVCENCGCNINVNYQPYHNIAHILSKQIYKSVAEQEDNILFLCTHKDHKDASTSCHADFDSSLKKRETMKVFPTAKERIKSLTIKEYGSERTQFENT